MKIKIRKYHSELKTLEWWISGLMLNPLFFLISRLNIACSPHELNLQIKYTIGIKDIPFKVFSSVVNRYRCEWVMRCHSKKMEGVFMVSSNYVHSSRTKLHLNIFIYCHSIFHAHEDKMTRYVIMRKPIKTGRKSQNNIKHRFTGD